jgi:AP-1-like transcription factor
VKELEAQVAALKQSFGSVSAENERLKLNLQKVSVENEILRATQARPGRSSPSEVLPDAGPMHYNPKDFMTEVLDGHPNRGAAHRITIDPDTGGKLLAVAATWDFIINHPLFKKGLVDMASVSERLKTKAKCDGQGPVFEERVVLDAIEKSVASGSDELM